MLKKEKKNFFVKIYKSRLKLVFLTSLHLLLLLEKTI